MGVRCAGSKIMASSMVSGYGGSGGFPVGARVAPKGTLVVAYRDYLLDNSGNTPKKTKPENKMRKRE